MQTRFTPDWSNELMMQKESADVVVIGGGVRGLVTAYYLSKAGVDVAVLEKRFVGAGATGLNTGYANVSEKGPRHYTEFSKMSADMYPALNEELGGGIEYERNGSLRIVETQAEWEAQAATVAERNQVPGLSMQMLEIDELRRLEPALASDLRGGSFCPIDGSVNPLKFVRALAQRAAQNGARIHIGCEVADIHVTAGRIEEVVTRQGRLATHVVVNAAGIHVPRIAAMVGLDVPVNAERGQLTITEALPRFMRRPIGPYTQFANGQVLIGVTNENVGENTGVTTAMIASRVRQALRILPVLKQATGIRCTAALRPMPPDRLPIYQKMDAVRDFYVTVGHSGITLAPVTGKVLADLITTGHTDIPLDPYRVERFKPQGATAH
ncbi:MAG: FAD-binding oxidoreductase [Desulfobacterales bacterium]|nr:MAG: FAD-binding oxidoreductase [Desulfobacterales bacterium]